MQEIEANRQSSNNSALTEISNKSSSIIKTKKSQIKKGQNDLFQIKESYDVIN